MADLSNVAPELVAHLEHLAKKIDDVDAPDGETARERAERVFPQRWGVNDSIYKISDITIDANGRELLLRIYEPENSVGSLVFLHGGGWVNGSIYTHDGSCIMLANESHMTVVAVNYSKAPEHKFPAGLNDGLVALDWLVGQGAQNIMVAGESAGGNIAAVVARHAREQGIKLNGQMLIYPALDARMVGESFKLFEAGYMISAADLTNCYNDYLPENANRENPDISPLLAPSLSGMCPTFIAVCDHDPLRDEGRAYAARLCAAGVDTSLAEIKGALHGIWIMRAVAPKLTNEIIGRAAAWINERNSRI